ncbi:MAG: NADH-quinone oxidoreductase subunit H [Candidatus Methanomethylicia archaeon]|nr:NADH-quinone oxidoreductase subunit H [Candidatus Methanomethylicia archaeon]
MHLALLFIIPILCFILGILLDYEIRKIFARSQYRFGPLTLMYNDLRSILGTSRILQPLYDILKLIYKNTIVPKSSHTFIFIFSPVMSFICAVLASYFIFYGGFSLLAYNTFSIIFLTYLIVGITFFWALGGLASSSPWSVIGVRREAELLLVIEVALISSIFSSSIIANSLSISEIVYFQRRYYPLLILNPFAAVTFILTILGKLHLNPFEIPEADVEIVSGYFTEYSGKLLATILASKHILTAILIGLFVDLFLGGGMIFPITTIHTQILNFIVFILKCLIVTFIVSILHSIMPRFRIDQAFSWSIKYLWSLSVLSILLSLLIKFILG